MPNAPHTIDGRFERALENAESFFMKTGRLHRATLQLAVGPTRRRYPMPLPVPWPLVATATNA